MEGQLKIMKYFKLIGLCLAAVFAFSALSAASAPALPDFVPAGGKFPVGFLASSGSVILTASNGFRFECEESMAAGNMQDVMMALIRANASTCHTTIAGTRIPCGNHPGAASDLILTEPLLATLGYIEAGEKAGGKVGFLFQPEPPNTVDIKFECGLGGVNETIVITGALVAEVTPINTATNKFDLIVKATGSAQAITTFQLLTGSPAPLFMTGIALGVASGEPLVPAAGAATNLVITTNENVTIKA
jgi:hypothetical protein